MAIPQVNNTQINNILLFLRDNQRGVYTIVTFLFLIITGVVIRNWNILMQNVGKQADELDLISSYNFSSLMGNDRLKEKHGFWTKISDMVGYGGDLQDEIEKAQKQRTRLSLPYDHFLHFLYVPPINIWKNPFDGAIDTTLIGEKYLENNPYGDIELIQQWTNFFKDMGTDKYNTITDISVGAVMPETGGHFSIPLTVQFETPDRRSFLLLLSKLSVTSYTENISLINEFIFSLWENIKKDKKDLIGQTLSGGSLPSQVKTEDDLLGYSFYQWIKNGSGNIFIDQDIINKTIIKVAGCIDQDSKECLYMFREKYRSIPYIAYGIAKDDIDGVKGLQQFLQKLPPLINLENFSFDKNKSKGRIKGDEGYKGSISLKVYGKDLSVGEVEEIADKLGGLCFANKTRLSVAYSVDILNKLIVQLGKDYSINEKRAKQLRQMISYITSMDSEYETLSNYKKVIKLFEIYRTIKEGSVCDVLVRSNEINNGNKVIIPVDVLPLPIPITSRIDNIDSPVTVQRKIPQEDFIAPADSGSNSKSGSVFGNTTPIRRTVFEDN